MEPDTHCQMLNNVTFIDCTSVDNAGFQWIMNVQTLNGSSRPLDVKVINMTVSGGETPPPDYGTWATGFGLLISGIRQSGAAVQGCDHTPRGIYWGDGALTGNVLIANSTVIGTWEAGLTILQKGAQAASVTVHNVSFVDVQRRQPSRAVPVPIAVLSPGKDTGKQQDCFPTGGVTFTECSVVDGLNRSFIGLGPNSGSMTTPAAGDWGLADVSGHFKVVNPFGCRVFIGDTNTTGINVTVASCNSGTHADPPQLKTDDRAVDQDRSSSASGSADKTARAVNASSLPCEFWIVEQNNYSQLPDLDASLGLQANRSISISGWAFGGASKAPCRDATSCAAFITENDTALRVTIAANVVPLVRNPTDLVVYDLEHPVNLATLNLLDDATLEAVVNATRRRLRITRELLPHASLAMYGTAGHGADTPAGTLAGYKRAGALGMWDELTHLVPVLYTGPGSYGGGLDTAVSARLDASLAIQPTTNKPLPMVPILSWVTFGSCSNKTITKGLCKNHCPVTVPDLRKDLAAIDKWSAKHPGRIAALQWWTGSDDDPNYCSNMTYLQWLHSANIVPPSCRK